MWRTIGYCVDWVRQRGTPLAILRTKPVPNKHLMQLVPKQFNKPHLENHTISVHNRSIRGFGFLLQWMASRLFLLQLSQKLRRNSIPSTSNLNHVRRVCMQIVSEAVNQFRIFMVCLIAKLKPKVCRRV